MKFDVTESYCEDGTNYFFGDLDSWLGGELRKRIKPSEYFTRNYGKDWTLEFVLSTRRRRKIPKILVGPEVERRNKTVAWLISVNYVGNKSLDPKSYALPIKQFIEGIIIALKGVEIDTSKLTTDLQALVKDFCSNPDMVAELVSDSGDFEITPKRAITKRRLPEWKIPKNIERVVDDEGATWESELFAPLRLMVISDTSSRGGKIPLRWQIELDIDLHDKQYASAGEKIKAMGNEPDGDGWTELIGKEFAKRYPKYATEFDSDSEMSTCVVSVESESACQKLIELVWSLIYPKPD